MAAGQVLCGGGGMPIYGRNGTILYAEPVSMSVDIAISWSGGSDVDICALYDIGGGFIGYGHGSEIGINGFVASWTSGDNTTGGPETVHLAYSGNRSSIADVHFAIHANWYAVGSDDGGGSQSGGGLATVTAVDASGRSHSQTVMPGTSRGRAATPGDPGVRINFNANGTIKSITQC